MLGNLCLTVSSIHHYDTWQMYKNSVLLWTSLATSHSALIACNT